MAISATMTIAMMIGVEYCLKISSMALPFLGNEVTEPPGDFLSQGAYRSGVRSAGRALSDTTILPYIRVKRYRDHVRSDVSSRSNLAGRGYVSSGYAARIERATGISQ